jgi:type II secretion system protein G
MQLIRNMLQDQKGFTLIELIIVVAILAVLAGAALMSSTGSEEEAKAAVANVDIKTLATAINVYKIKEGDFPADLDALLTDGPNGKYKPMLDELPESPYGVDYAYADAVDADGNAIANAKQITASDADGNEIKKRIIR